jgi:putative transposase
VSPGGRHQNRHLKVCFLYLSMPKGYKREETCVHLMNYHFVFCPKYRRRILVGDVKVRLKELIMEKVKGLDSEVLRLEVMPDHVHLFVASRPTVSPNSLVGQVKGFSSRRIREEFPDVRRCLPTLWTRSYFVSTAGNVSSSVIQKYIDEQIGR